MITRSCELCGASIEAADVDAFADTFLVHVKAAHADLPYPDVAISNYGAGLARMTGSTERLPVLGAVEIHPVTAGRVDDWLQLMDFDAFAGMPQWSACYCAEPHLYDPADEGKVMKPWREKRALMEQRLRDGTTEGYVAYVDGRPAGWVNASMRCEYGPLHRRGDADDDVTVGVACFAIAPPYRGHGLARRLLERVIADAPGRGAQWVEAYPFTEGRGSDNPNFRGPRPMYDAAGFTEVKVRQHDVVVRREA